jgi:uncharacterized protein (TIGR02300 family)
LTPAPGTPNGAPSLDIDGKLTLVAKPELGTKRVCPTTGRKFYDLNRDPIVSPYTGQVLPRALFEPLVKGAAAAVARAPRIEEELEAEAAAPELVSLEDVEAEEKEKEAGADDDVEIAAVPADDPFLEEEEEGDDNVTDLIDGDIEDDEEA